MNNIKEEFEKCKDPYYFYMKYTKLGETHPLTREQWDMKMDVYNSWLVNRKLRSWRR